MDPIIFPSKIILSIGVDGKCSASVIQYKVRNGAEIDGKFRTMDVLAGLDKAKLEAIVEGALQRVKDGEGTNLVRVRESEEQVRERIKNNLKKKDEGGSQ